jgi:signal transduction histidine kinase
LQAVGELMEGIVVQLWQLHEEDGVLISLGSYGLDKTAPEKTLAIPVGQGVVGRVAASRSPIAVEDLRVDPHLIPRHLVEQEGLISFLGVPLVWEEKLAGVLSILTRTPHRFNQDEMGLFASFAQQVAIALENAHCYQDLQHSYQELLAAQADLVRKTRMATIGEIAAAVSHETRNFLGALSTCVQLLQKNPHITGPDAELLDIIQSGSQWFNEVVSEVSALGCSSPPHFQDVDLHELIDETFALLQRDDRCPSSIVIRRQFDPSLQKVQVDRDQLGQVFRHLFLNAVQAMGDQGQLQVQTQRVDSQVKIFVRDTGPGIPTTILPNIFEPFYSTKSGRIGLGLAIVRRIVEEHRGQIIVDSEQETGTCFVVALPFEPKAD